MSAKMLKVKGYDSLYRDPATGAIINNSEVEYTQYVTQRQSIRDRNSEIRRQAEEINMLKDDLSDIKNLLQKILEK